MLSPSATFTFCWLMICMATRSQRQSVLLTQGHGVEEAVVDVTSMDPGGQGGEHAIQALLDATTAAHHGPHHALQEHIAGDVEAAYPQAYEQVATTAALQC